MITANYVSEDTEMAVFVKYHYLKLNKLQSKILISVFVSVSALVSAKKIPAIPAKANTVTGLLYSHRNLTHLLCIELWFPLLRRTTRTGKKR